MLYQISNGCVKFAADTILEHINFEIRSTEKIAVVGRNGCGKTTLLKLIAGEVELSKRDSDEDIFIAKAGKPTIGYLKQVAFEEEDITLEEEVRKVFAPVLKVKDQMERALALTEAEPSEENVRRYTRLQEQFQNMGGYDYDREYDLVFRQFGFRQEDKTRRMSEFSGGQRSRIAFVKLLLSRPDIMLLDEPTNHLDMTTVEWLEQYLKNYDKAVVVVSHDRMFLDNVADVVYEIEYKTAKRYPGNYTRFVETKQADYEKQLKDYTLQQKEIKRLETLVERFKNKPTKVAMTRSKLKAIEHMDKIENPAAADLRSFHTRTEPAVASGNDVLSVHHLQVGYDHVLSDISFEVKRGERIGVIGDNGTGKSTFLKTLVGRVDALGGEFRYGTNVEIGYFDQESAQYASDKNVLEDFWDTFPGLTQTEARSALGAFLFSGDDVFKAVRMLSGGEKARLALCKIFQRKPNLLILDEPTNHMDIVGKETLENMLKGYQGTVLFVSHDRYFVKSVADKLLLLREGEECARFYPFGYEQYRQETENQSPEGPPQNGQSAAGARQAVRPLYPVGTDAGRSAEKKNAAEKNYSNPGREKAKLERRIARQEEKIAVCEEEIADLKEQWADPKLAADYVELARLQLQIEEKEKQLEELMEEYLLLSEQADGGETAGAGPMEQAETEEDV